MPVAPLLLAGAAWIGLVVGRRAGRPAGIDPEPVLWRMLMLALLFARLGFVWQWRGVYLNDPLSILDIRDGGWEPVVGVAAASLYGLSQVSRQAVLRRPVGAASVVTLTLWLAGQAASLAWPVDRREVLPGLSLPSLDGPVVTLSSYVGKPTVVNLWATWCPPCRREMPLLQQAQGQHADVNFVFVDQGETRDEVARYLASQGLTLGNVLLDAHKASGAAFDAPALPTTLFFDGRGHLVSTRVGSLSEATLAQRLTTIGAGGQVPPVGQAATK